MRAHDQDFDHGGDGPEFRAAGGRAAAVVFDLDDTLIDTKGVLLPDALARTARALGVGVARLDARGKKFDEVVRDLPELPKERREAGMAAWYSPEVPPLQPFPGVRETLAALKPSVSLFLLTRGDPVRQAHKIAACGLEDFFDEIVIRPIEAPGTKRDDLRALLSGYGLSPERLLVVGDDETDEGECARDLGCPFFLAGAASFLAGRPALLAAIASASSSRRSPG